VRRKGNAQHEGSAEGWRGFREHAATRRGEGKARHERRRGEERGRGHTGGSAGRRGESHGTGGGAGETESVQRTELRVAEANQTRPGLVIPCGEKGFGGNTSHPNEGGDLHYIA
jgi:hypothetical protein